MLGRDGIPVQRVRDYAQLFNQQGWHALFIDSLRGRGYASVCGQSRGTVEPSMRVPDVQAAIALIGAWSQVDTRRIGIVGWSHGGSTALLEIGRAHV